MEALRLYVSAEAMKDKQRLKEALDLLEKARKIDPDSTAVLRQISRLSMALGRIDSAVAVARKLVEIEPGDTPTLELLVEHYLERKNDPAAAEALLKKVAANPKLEKSSPGYYLIHAPWATCTPTS